jgi:hypothetical protein
MGMCALESIGRAMRGGTGVEDEQATQLQSPQGVTGHTADI